MRSIPESDWKRFKPVREKALERFSQRVLDEARAIAGSEGESAHARYLRLYKTIQRQDDDMAQVFNDFRRSTALFRLTEMVQRDLVTDEEFEAFTEETQTVIRTLVGD